MEGSLERNFTTSFLRLWDNFREFIFLSYCTNFFGVNYKTAWINYTSLREGDKPLSEPPLIPFSRIKGIGKMGSGLYSKTPTETPFTIINSHQTRLQRWDPRAVKPHLKLFFTPLNSIKPAFKDGIQGLGNSICTPFYPHFLPSNPHLTLGSWLWNPIWNLFLHPSNPPSKMVSGL